MSNIGDRNRLIEVWAHDGTKDASNELSLTGWHFFKRKWARVRGETGMATIRGAASADGINTPLDRYSYRVDFDRSVTQGMQLRDGTIGNANIIAVRHDVADREWTDIVAEFGGANG